MIAQSDGRVSTSRTAYGAAAPRGFLRDVRGGMGVVGAGLVIVFTMVGAIAVDAGSIFVARKRLQSAVDAAVISAAQFLPDRSAATSSARQVLVRNFDRATLLRDPEFGVYVAQEEGVDGQQAMVYPVSRRFRPEPSANAALRVVAATDAPVFLAKIVGLDAVRVTATATAARPGGVAAMQVASGLVSLDTARSELLDTVLGSLAGTRLQLNLVHYRGLADTEIDLFAYMDALAASAKVNAGSYDRLMATEIAPPGLLGALGDLVRKEHGLAAGNAALGLQLLAGALSTLPAVPVGDIVQAETRQRPNGEARVSALAVVRAITEAANGRHGLSTELTLDAGPTSLQLLATVVERPQTSKVGPAGTFVRTAQIRLRLIVEASLPTGADPATRPLGDTLAVRVPLYMELGSGSAELVDVACSGSRAAPSAVRVRVRSGVVDLAIADVTRDAVRDVSRPVDTRRGLLAETTLPVLGQVKITAYGKTSIGQAQRDVRFAAPYGAGTTASASAFGVDSAGSTLLSDTAVRFTGSGGAGFTGLLEDLSASVAQALQPMFVAVAGRLLDGLIDDLAEVLGVGIGTTEVQVPYANCDASKVVI